jgi:hypothetical protein
VVLARGPGSPISVILAFHGRYGGIDDPVKHRLAADNAKVGINLLGKRQKASKQVAAKLAFPSVSGK